VGGAGARGFRRASDAELTGTETPRRCGGQLLLSAARAVTGHSCHRYLGALDGPRRRLSGIPVFRSVRGARMKS
jgi:hypothetical protein